MVTTPESLSQFFATSAGAAATLIGLLSVANSIIGEKHNSPAASIQQSILAESSYGAFANIFFVTLCALVPFVNVGYITILMACVGFITIRQVLGRGIHKLSKLDKAKARISQGLLLASAVIYGLELVIGVLLVLNKQDHWTALTYTILALYGIGMARAWELLGVRKVLR